MKRNLAIDHVLLAASDRGHLGMNGTGDRAERSSVLRKIGNPRTPYFVLGGQARDGRAGAAHPSTLYDADFLAGTSKIPGEQFAALTAAKDEDIKTIGIGQMRNPQSLK
jgi:hypothetical protein